MLKSIKYYNYCKSAKIYLEYSVYNSKLYSCSLIIRVNNMNLLRLSATITIILASIVIMSSCEDKSVAPTPTPKLVIKSFSPQICSFGDTITIIGSNFDLSANLALTLTAANSSQQIVTISKKADEIKFIAPTILPGNYNIILTIPNDTVKADSQLVINYRLNLDSFKRFELLVEKIPADWERTSYYQWQPDPPVNQCDTIMGYSINFTTTKYSYEYIKLKTSKMDTVNYSSNTYAPGGVSLNLIRSLNRAYDLAGLNMNGAVCTAISQTGTGYTYYGFKIFLQNLNFQRLNDTLFLELSGTNLINKLTGFDYYEYGGSSSGHQSSSMNNRIIKLLPLVVDSRIRFKLY